MHAQRTFAILLLTCLVASTTAALGANFSHPAYAPAGGFTSIPVGHADFCARFPSECSGAPELVDMVQLNQDLWTELLDVNSTVNMNIAPVEDKDLYLQEEFWTFPSGGAGDCEDYVLAKKKILAERGWPASAMLITVVKQENGSGHAVLMVRTDRGDLVLDNQASLISTWNVTPYKYLKRQSQSDAGRWVDLQDERQVQMAKTEGSTEESGTGVSTSALAELAPLP